MNSLRTALDTIIGYYILIKSILRARLTLTHKCSDNNNVAILLWEFAPSITGGVYRPAALTRELIKDGYNVRIIAGPAPSEITEAGKELLEHIGKDISIHRFSASNLKPSYRYFPQIDGGILNAIKMYECATTMLSQSPPGVIIASGPPFLSFVAGFLCKLHFKAQLILDYRDEWCQNPFDFVSKGLADSYFENLCLKKADLIVMTTASQKYLIGQLHGPAISNKTTVVPNGWESAFEQNQKPLEAQKNRKVITLTFAGKLGGHTDPTNFLKTMEILTAKYDLERKVLIRFIGYKTQEAQRVLDNYKYPIMIDDIKQVPLTKAKELMRQADALLLFHDDRFKRYLPGKLYEYLASRKPIILLDDTGESSKLLQSLNYGWALDSNDGCRIYETLRLIASHKMTDKNETTSTTEDLENWLKKHTREATAKFFIKKIKNTVGQ